MTNHVPTAFTSPHLKLPHRPTLHPSQHLDRAHHNTRATTAPLPPTTLPRRHTRHASAAATDFPLILQVLAPMIPQPLPLKPRAARKLIHPHHHAEAHQPLIPLLLDHPVIVPTLRAYVTTRHIMPQQHPPESALNICHYPPALRSLFSALCHKTR